MRRNVLARMLIDGLSYALGAVLPGAPGLAIDVASPYNLAQHHDIDCERESIPAT